MKLIDLLNKIANEEEVPKVIKYNDYNFRHIDNYCYVNKEGELLSTYIYAEENRLNDEIEIIEDTPKEDNKIKHICGNTKQIFDENELYIIYKINEIIDHINKKEGV